MSDLTLGEEEDVELSEPQVQWLAAEAARHDLEPEEVLDALLTAYQQATADDVEYVEAEDLAATRAEFQELLEDVRNRVVQVKREADQKAPADHEHSELAEQVGATQTSLKQLQTAVTELTEQTTALESEVETLDETVAGGFENYEEILEYLLDHTDTLEGRLDTLATAALETRSQLREVSGERREQELLSELKADANREGITQASCGNCGQRIDVGLLTKPRCPHCSTTFTELGVEKRLGGLLTDYRLQGGDHPELTGSKQSKLDEEIAEELETTSETPDFTSGEEPE